MTIRPHVGAMLRRHTPTRQTELRSILVAVAALAALAAAAGGAHRAMAGTPEACTGYSRCPEANYLTAVTRTHDARAADVEVYREEQAALDRWHRGDLNAQEREQVLGKALLYDVDLSVRHNEACASCHLASSGFDGAISIINQVDVAYPGSVLPRSGPRKPMSYSYAPFAPILHYRAATDDFVGGNFWDERATGEVTGNPAGDQALGPPLNPAEMGLPDAACVIRRIAQSPYASLFREVWGTNALSVSFPADTDRVCAQPADGSGRTVVSLSAADRARVTTSFHDMARSIAAFEAGREVSPFNAKFDRVLHGQARFTAQESQGLALFRGKAQCDQCHVSTGAHPLFTDFTAVNLGLPKNLDVPYLYENRPDARGFVANPNGPSFKDEGLGAILATSSNEAWRDKARAFLGTFQVATLRNVDRKPRPGYIRGYFHNGYFKTLKEVVHFYNVRDVLPHCQDVPDESRRIGSTCYPAPEEPRNVNHTQTGNLHLTDAEEDAIVAFLRTLTDESPNNQDHDHDHDHDPGGDDQGQH